MLILVSIYYVTIYSAKTCPAFHATRQILHELGGILVVQPFGMNNLCIDVAMLGGSIYVLHSGGSFFKYFHIFVIWGPKQYL